MIVALLALSTAPSIASLGQAVHPAAKAGQCSSVTAKAFRPFSKRAWSPSRWERGEPKPAVRAAYQRKLRCAAGIGHRQAIEARWSRDRERYRHHRQRELARRNINHPWEAHWSPDFSGPTLPPYVIAALAEAAGDALGVDVPGWTMAQMTRGESGGRPGAAAVDPGGRSAGYGLWAVTSPFNDDLVAPLGGYHAMWNPVRNAAVMALIYERQGLGAWYGDGYVTAASAHYRGRFDIRLVLGGLTFGQALKR